MDRREKLEKAFSNSGMPKDEWLEKMGFTEEEFEDYKHFRVKPRVPWWKRWLSRIGIRLA